MFIILLYIFFIPIHNLYKIQFKDLFLKEEFIDYSPLILILDVIINMNTGFFEKGICVKKRIYIFKHFIKENWFN